MMVKHIREMFCPRNTQKVVNKSAIGLKNILSSGVIWTNLVKKISLLLLLNIAINCSIVIGTIHFTIKIVKANVTRLSV
jgi:hypothetical protein